MSMLGKRLEKLELGASGGLVVFFVDQFTEAEEEPVIRGAYSSGRLIEPEGGEPQADFVRRVKPSNRPAAMLETVVSRGMV